MERIVITGEFVSLLYMGVCIEQDATDEEVLEYCNLNSPPGVRNGWVIVKRTDDEQQPVPCGDFPGRLHVLVGC